MSNFIGQKPVHSAVAKRPCPTCNAIQGALCFNPKLGHPWATQVHKERRDADNNVPRESNERGFSAQEDRVCATLGTCTKALQLLHPTQQARVMRGIHAWYTSHAGAAALPPAEGDL